LECESTGNSLRKSYTAKFKLEVVEVAKEKGNHEAGRLMLERVVFGNGKRLKHS
jgi:hypothetical protein